MGASIRESQIRLLTPDQKEMAECIGFEAYSKLSAYYGGSRVYVAKLASLELAERDSRIIRDYKAGKTSTAELAARYGVSPRRIRKSSKSSSKTRMWRNYTMGKTPEELLNELSEADAALLGEDCQALIRAIGLEGFKKLIQEFSGVQLYIPKQEKVCRYLRDKKIRQEFDGSNHKTLAKKYGVTEAWCRKIIASEF